MSSTYFPINVHAVEHAEQRREGESGSQHRLHLHHRQVAVVVLQLLLISFDLLLVLFVQRVAQRLFPFLHWKYVIELKCLRAFKAYVHELTFFALLLYLRLQFLEFVGAVNKQPSES